MGALLGCIIIAIVLFMGFYDMVNQLKRIADALEEICEEESERI